MWRKRDGKKMRHDDYDATSMTQISFPRSALLTDKKRNECTTKIDLRLLSYS